MGRTDTSTGRCRVADYLYFYLATHENVSPRETGMARFVFFVNEVSMASTYSGGLSSCMLEGAPNFHVLRTLLLSVALKVGSRHCRVTRCPPKLKPLSDAQGQTGTIPMHGPPSQSGATPATAPAPKCRWLSSSSSFSPPSSPLSRRTPS